MFQIYIVMLSVWVVKADNQTVVVRFGQRAVSGNTTYPSQNGWSSSEIVSFVAGTLIGAAFAVAGTVISFHLAKRSEAQTNLSLKYLECLVWRSHGHRHSRIDTRLVHGNIDSVQEFSRASTLVDDEEAGPSIELQNLKPPPRAFVGASGMPRAGLPRTHAAEYHTYHWSVSVSSYEGEEYEDGLIEN